MKNALLLFLAMSVSVVLYGQRTVSGTVTDVDGEPLIGANVTVVGEDGYGTITDFDGYYELQVPEGAKQLLLTYTGYEQQTVEIGNQTTIDVVLNYGVTLDEAIVTALGLESNKRKVGYAIENLTQEDFENSGENDIVRSLSSKVAGLSVVSSSGSPGASANIRLRGSTSITGNNSPLFVIDGVPIDNSTIGNDVDGVDVANRLVDIDQNDIADISVLKGAAATAIYGIRAANGVILLTTKKGKEGKPRVSVNASVSIDQVNQLPERQNQYAQGSPVEQEDGSLAPGYRGPETFEGFSWGPKISDLEFDGSTDYPYDRNGRLVPVGQGNGQPAQAYDPYDFFINGITTDLNASVGGGNNVAKYFISGGRRSVDGFIPNSTFERTSFRVNSQFQVSDRLQLEGSGSYTNSGGNRLQRGSNLRGVMLGLLRNTPTFDVGNGLSGQDAADAKATYENPDGTERSYRAGIYDNPYWVVNKNLTENTVNRFIGYAGLSYDLLSNLQVKYKLGIDNYNDTRSGHIGLVPDGFGGFWDAGSITNRDVNSRDINSDLLLLYNTALTSDFKIDVTLGHNYFNQKLTNRLVEGATLSIPDFYDISNASNVVTSVGARNRELVGAFGVIDMNLFEYLFPSVTLRNDWSSTLPAENNSFFSYSANLGFAFTDIPGLSIPGVEYGKLRASYGSVGLDAPVYATTPYFNQSVISGDGFLTDNVFPAFGTNSFELSNQLPNSLLTPERTNTLEFGLEMQFWKGRVGFDVTYYDSESVDQIIPVETSAATGFTTAILNSGRVTNSGIELLVNFTPVRTKNFSLDFDLNFTSMENDVEALADGVENVFLAGFVSTSSRAIAGQPFGAIFGNGFERTESGEVLIGEDGFPIVDPTPKVLGNPIPDWTAGLRTTLTFFKDLRVSALLDVRSGGDMWCGTCGIMDYFGTSQTTGDLREGEVVFDGVKSDGSVNTQAVPYYDPSAGLGTNYWVKYGFGGISEMSIYDASWVRLREVSVSYTLPQNIVSKVGMSNASIAVSARNLWLSTDYPGIDPETNLTGASNGFGLDYFNNPNTKGYTFTLRTNF